MAAVQVRNLVLDYGPARALDDVSLVFPNGELFGLLGPSGSGKTTLGLHFLAASQRGERGLFFSFYEPPEFLRSVAKLQGIDPRGVLAGNSVEFQWQSFGENMLDEMAVRLLERAAALGAKRVVIDGAGGFTAAPGYPDRGGPFLATLLSELRRTGATTLLTVEEQENVGTRELDTPTMSATADTVLELRLRRETAIRRFICVRKSRISRTDLHLRELVMGPEGLAVIEGGAVVGA